MFVVHERQAPNVPRFKGSSTLKTCSTTSGGRAELHFSVSSLLSCSILLSPRLPLSIATLIAARAFGFGVVVGIGAGRQECSGFGLPGSQSFVHGGSFVRHSFREVALFVGGRSSS